MNTWFVLKIFAYIFRNIGLTDFLVGRAVLKRHLTQQLFMNHSYVTLFDLRYTVTLHQRHIAMPNISYLKLLFRCLQNTGSQIMDYGIMDNDLMT